MFFTGLRVSLSKKDLKQRKNSLNNITSKLVVLKKYFEMLTKIDILTKLTKKIFSIHIRT